MIQFITNTNDPSEVLDSIRMALEGGCRWVQLRMKEAPAEHVTAVAHQAVGLCHKVGAKLIIDDHVQVTRAAGADGVHLGLTDMPLPEARTILGTDYIIGGTANTIDNIRRVVAGSADYIGLGPFRFTTTKKNLAPYVGLTDYSHIVRQMRQAGIHVPVVAIGGITADDIPQVMATGVDGIALSGAILRAADPVAEMRRVVELEQKYRYK